MPLTDFVRYLNAQLPTLTSAQYSHAPFFSDAGRICVYYADLRLESVFCPIVDNASGELCGHAAQLRVLRKRDGRALEPGALFALPRDDREFVFLDRLVRTLHTLNYLTYRPRQRRGLLLLKIHPRHVTSVSADHGVAFEEILRACGLLPEQITLEFETPAAGERTHWVRAMGNYRARAYGIAVKRFAGSEADFALLESVRPTVVRIDLRLPAGALPLRPCVERLQALGARVLVDGADSEGVRHMLRQSGINYLQRASTAPLAPAGAWSAAA